MRKALLVAWVLLSSLTQTAHAATTVRFEHPERFLDIEDVDRSAAANLAILEKKLVDLGQRYLQPGDDVAITITNVDLAGRILPGGSTAPNPRVLDGNADWPRIALRYSETRDGTTVGPVDEVLTDQSYLAFGPVEQDLRQPLIYEQRMLERWFKERFVDRKPPRSGRKGRRF